MPTSTIFPFLVGLPTADKTVPLLDTEFRYTTRSVRAMERSAGCGLAMLQAQLRSVETLVLLVCYGRTFDDRKMTEDKATDQIDEFLAAGGSVTELADALFKALNASGVYGKPRDETTGGETPLEKTPASA